MLTQEIVKDLFDYKDGALYWKVRAAKNVFAGDRAGFMQGNGYHGVVVNHKIHALHRVIFLHQHGFLPEVVDHIDGNILNNTVENLRAATRAKNGANQRISAANTSGVKNVSWCKVARKWTVMVQKNGVQHYFGRYEDLGAAALVAKQARIDLHQIFARHV